MAAAAESPLLVEQDARGVATLTLNRPRRHNAFDAELIAGLTAELTRLDTESSVRAVVLAARGRSFSAGADLNWMRRMSEASPEANRADAVALGRLLAALDGISKPTLAVVQGAAFGGGVGLVAACDIAIAAEGACFCLSEVKLGLAPATVAPYVLRAIGGRQARRYFITAERFDAARAQALGLVHEVVRAEALGLARERLLEALAAGGPEAQAAVKKAIGRYRERPIDDALIADSVELIAGLRRSPEGREGIAAFLDKRAPAWRERE